MRVTRFAALFAAIALLAAGQASAGDKSQSTFTRPGGVTGVSLPATTGPLGTTFVNGTDSGKSKGDDKCKVQIQLKGLSLPDSDQVIGTGDEVICVSHASVSTGMTGLATTAVFRGEVKSGGVKIKADLFVEGTGCIPTGGGGPSVSQYEAVTSCYEPDPTYPDPPVGFMSDPSQGIYIGAFGPRPASGLIANTGLSFLP
jgi:hypothetical protein